ncbi:alpha/beta fold hydrolase [Agrilutibacter solisilvae]|uniref:Alpha/beta hydrolase n=1 Tax=Agrilutibacter solisilvae TaxID=2763317 RepID=A0A975AS37_9GAMM|nr:alpha/beta hydrolase [Lysobacter solisilvae]QSX78514.1 alpha/beta hydrolase [Lysobacter solisilvae]
MIRRVVLLHGIWMPGVVMRWLAARLSEAGFQCETFGYYGVAQGPDQALPSLVDTLAREPCHVVAHSLGGLVAMQALVQHPQLPVERLLCLGSPLRGSGAAQGMRRHAWSAVTLGRAATLLEGGFGQWSGRAQVGVIAGTSPVGLGHLFGTFQGEHDGSVSVEETRLPGIADHAVVHASHSGMLFSPEVAALASAFLQHGTFHAAQAPPGPAQAGRDGPGR